MRTYDQISKLEDAFADLFTTLANTIAEHQYGDPDNLYDIVNDTKRIALKLYVDELWARNADEGRSDEKIEELNEQIGDALAVARSITELMPIAFTHHDDAKRYGWTDRDDEAWSIVTDLYVEAFDLIPASK